MTDRTANAMKESNDVPMPTLQGHLVRLTPVSQSDLGHLYGWMNDPESLMLWINRRELTTYAQFVDDLEWRLKHMIVTQLMIRRHGTDEPIGTVYAYDANVVDGYAFGTIYLPQTYRRQRFGIDALIVFIDYLFAYFPFRKLYSEVYSYNHHSFAMMQSAGAVEEGRLREHRYFDGHYADLYRFALYRRDWPGIRAKCQSFVLSQQ